MGHEMSSADASDEETALLIPDASENSRSRRIALFVEPSPFS